MFDLTTVWLLMLCFGIGWSFWQFRRFAELAASTANEYCEKYHLQLLSVSRRNWQLSLKQGLQVRVLFNLNYSADGLTSRQGEIEIVNGKVTQVSHWS